MTVINSPLGDALRDRYRLERELGRGGMATVYLAHDLRHDRSVALKVLHPELAQALGSQRFQREIRLAAQLQHPNILTVLDSGEAAGQFWFAMPFVEGESLRDRLRRERQLSVDQALRITTETARALEYAHQHGIIHRDIKPENLLLTADGSTLVADFGIARALGASPDQLTETGIAVGTPAYMSPEQAAGDRGLDARTDVYSLGTVFYEMLVGEPPYTGATPQALIAKRFSGAVPRVRSVRPSVSETVEHAVIKALAMVPADRFASAAEFAHALESPAATAPGAASGVPQAGGSVPGRPGPARRRLPVALLVGLGVLTLGGLGSVLWERNSQTRAGPPNAGDLKRLAVLPFENLGDSTDAYFADGITDAVRGKLTALPGLQVTARRSSSQYRTTSKSPQQIGKELGVQYLLTATVRWEKERARTCRVLVSPELIEASTGAAKWQQPFDGALTDIFQVQGTIAERVAEALHVALGASEHRILAEKPTQTLGAYDAFLKGEELSVRASGGDVSALRRAVGHYQQAVALDSTFVMAWVRLAFSQSYLYSGGYIGGASGPAEANAARRAAERALALRPNGYEGHLALGSYYLYATGDYRRALDEATQGLRVAPERPELLDVAGTAEIYLGLWDSALVHSQQEQLLDPRSVDAVRSLANIFLFMRRYSEALAACDRGLTLAPADLLLLRMKVGVYLALGDLNGAQSVIRAAPREAGVPAMALTTFMSLWVLEDEDQQHLLRLSPINFDGHREIWASALAETYWLRGDRIKAGAYADSARQTYEVLLRNRSDDYTDAVRHVSLGLMFALLGRKPDAIREGERGLALLPVSEDAVFGAFIQSKLARIYVLVEEPEKALDHLESLLRTPSHLSSDRLRIDPTLASLRGNPRFERLTRKLDQ